MSWLFRSDVEFHVSHDVVWIHGTAISQTAPRLQVNQVRVYTDAGNFLAFNVGAEAGIREHSPHKKNRSVSIFEQSRKGSFVCVLSHCPKHELKPETENELVRACCYNFSN